MTAVMSMTFEVSAKIETLRLDGVTQHTVQGRLSVVHQDAELQGEPLSMGMALPTDLWANLSVGDVLEFPLHNPWMVTV